jgi:hypothetical protein
VDAESAKGSLSIEQSRREVEVAPRYDPVLEYGPDGGLVLRVTSRSQQPAQAIQVEISGLGVIFDASRRDRGDPVMWIRSNWVAFWHEPLFQDASASWPMRLDLTQAGRVSDRISLTIVDLADRNRTVTVGAKVPPLPQMGQAARPSGT